MNYEEKISELEERIKVLEKAENKRITKRKIKIIFEVTKIVVFIVLILFVYININNKIIKPYKEKVDYVTDKVNYVEEKISDIEKVTQELSDKVKKFFKL